MYELRRETLETKIYMALDPKRPYQESNINTGIGFFDHMLTLLSFHSQLYLDIQADGDLEVDGHHTVEDVGIVFGQLLRQYYRDLTSYQRYGFFYLPMDETLARVALDLSGRPYLVFAAEFSRETVGTFATELTEEFFNAVAMNSRMTLHIDLIRGGNCHHEIEGIFKAFAKSLRLALTEVDGQVPSSKGVIE